MTRYLAIAFLIGILLFAVVACKSGDEQDKADRAAQAAAEAAAKTNPDNPFFHPYGSAFGRK